jgi:hypothetical protein
MSLPCERKKEEEIENGRKVFHSTSQKYSAFEWEIKKTNSE